MGNEDKMENYFQPKENLKTEENVNDFAEETVKNNMQEDDQNGDIEEQKNLEINAQNENTENAQDENNDDIQGDMKETAGTESENSAESGVDKENFELLNGENLQEKPDNFVLKDAEVNDVGSVETAAENFTENPAENLAGNEAENTDESGIKYQHENETENFAYIMPSGNYFKPQSANDTAFNKTQKQPAIKKLPFVFSMLGLLLSIFYIGLPFAIAGLVMTIIQKHKGETDELTKTSYVLSFAGIAIGLFTLILFVFCLIF